MQEDGEMQRCRGMKTWCDRYRCATEGENPFISDSIGNVQGVVLGEVENGGFNVRGSPVDDRRRTSFCMSSRGPPPYPRTKLPPPPEPFKFSLSYSSSSSDSSFSSSPERRQTMVKVTASEDTASTMSVGGGGASEEQSKWNHENSIGNEENRNIPCNYHYNKGHKEDKESNEKRNQQSRNHNRFCNGRSTLFRTPKQRVEYSPVPFIGNFRETTSIFTSREAVPQAYESPIAHPPSEYGVEMVTSISQEEYTPVQRLIRHSTTQYPRVRPSPVYLPTMISAKSGSYQSSASKPLPVNSSIFWRDSSSVGSRPPEGPPASFHPDQLFPPASVDSFVDIPPPIPSLPHIWHRRSRELPWLPRQRSHPYSRNDELSYHIGELQTDPAMKIYNTKQKLKVTDGAQDRPDSAMSKMGGQNGADSPSSCSSSHNSTSDIEGCTSGVNSNHRRSGSMGEAWSVQLSKLCEYRQKYGHCMVPQKFKESPSLGVWVNKQR